MNQENKPTYEELEEKVKLLEKKITDDNNILQILLDTIPNPVFYKDKLGIYRNCNDAFSKTILGINKEKIIGKSLFDLPDVIPAKLAKLYYEKDNTLFDNPGTQFYEGNVKCANSDVKTFLFYKATVENEIKDVIGIVGVMLDVTELKENQLKLEELSNTDSLTGIYNRRKFDDIFLDKVKASNRYKSVLNFALVDIDNFKLYNDNYGHSEGDNVLRLVSDCFKKRLSRSDDYLFRLGGEEFGFLFYSKNADMALDFMNKIRVDIENLNIKHTYNCDFNKLTVSTGLISIKNFCEDVKLIFNESDKLLYEAKKTGRNKVMNKTI